MRFSSLFLKKSEKNTPAAREKCGKRAGVLGIALNILLAAGKIAFGALSGVGEKAAYSIYEAAQKGDFVSREEFQIEAGVSKTIIQNLSELGAMNDLPDTNQISMF